MEIAFCSSAVRVAWGVILTSKVIRLAANDFDALPVISMKQQTASDTSKSMVFFIFNALLCNLISSGLQATPNADVRSDYAGASLERSAHEKMPFKLTAELNFCMKSKACTTTSFRFLYAVCKTARHITSPPFDTHAPQPSCLGA